jgi:hypothetical protein
LRSNGTLSRSLKREVSDIVAGAGCTEETPQFGVEKEVENKKEPPLPAAQGDNREASNRVDRSHSMSRKLDEFCNERESLTKS